MASSLRGTVRVAHPSSSAHALLDTTQVLRVRVQLFALPPLELDDAAATRAMSLECVLHERIPPVQSVRAQHQSSAPASGPAAAGGARPEEHVYAFAFSSLAPGRYHVLAFTELESTDADGKDAARYTDPQRQAFGFVSEGAPGGNAWPWSVLELQAGERVLQPFVLRVAHSFSVLEGSVNARGFIEASAVTSSLPAIPASLRLLPGSRIPVLRLGAASSAQRGFAHGLLLAPYILDFWRFYMLEFRFSGNVAKYNSFVTRWAAPAVGFFSYPAERLAEARGVVEGMRASGVSLWMEELSREIGVDDILAGYIETRTAVSSEPAWAASAPAASSAASGAAPAPASTQADKSLAHNCSQVVIWGQHTAAAGGSVIAGRNMDGEIDIRKVTATHSILIATERDAASSSSAASFRTISFMWPGLIGTLTGINETGLYMCENAGETQPGSGLVSGLTPVSCIQQEALRKLDGRSLTIPAMQQFLEPYISHSGWDAAAHKKTDASQRNQEHQAKGIAQYASATQGGFSGPGSIFVLAMPPKTDQAAAVAPAPVQAFVLECDRTHTAFRVPGMAPPHDVPQSLLATNHALSLGFDDVGVVSREIEARRAPTEAHNKCASLSPLYGGAAANARFTNWNVEVALKSHWRFEAGRNRLQALERVRRRAAVTAGQSSAAALGVEDVKDLLRCMCPGYTEHSFIGEMRADGSVRVHVAVADSSVGQWEAPYAPWHAFDFNELFD